MPLYSRFPPASGLIVVIFALAACSPAPEQAAKPAPPAARPKEPEKTYEMVCKSSRTGLPAACGTPNAVMVGMREAAPKANGAHQSAP